MHRHYSNHERFKNNNNEYYENENDMFRSHHSVPVRQLMRNSSNIYENNNNNNNVTSTSKNNIYSYNNRDEPFNIKIQLNKSSSKDLYVENRMLNNNSKQTNNLNYISHSQNEFNESKRSSLTNMDNNIFYFDKQKQNNDFNKKSNVIVVRSMNNNEIEDLSDNEQIIEQPKQEPKATKQKRSERKSLSFKEPETIEFEKKNIKSNTKRSSSVNIDKNDVDKKRLFKNNTALGGKLDNDSSSSEDDDDEDEEEEDVFTTRRKKGLSGRMMDIEEKDEEEEVDNNLKIFPNGNINKNNNNKKPNENNNDNKINKQVKEMFNLLENKKNTLDFIMKKAPQNSVIKTRIKRTKRKFSTQYTMFLEMPNGDEIALMQTKRKRASTRIYITISALELVEKQADELNELERYVQIPCGKLKSKNKLKVVYDNFILTNNAKKTSSIMKGVSFFGKKGKKIQNDSDSNYSSEVYREFLNIEYENSIYKISQPLKFSIQLINNTIHKSKHLDYDMLVTKGPKFDKEKNKYILDFNSRVTQASVNNFQIILANPDFQDDIILQSGKTKNNEYICDYSYPLSAFEAFGIVLSAFNRKFV